MAMVANVVMVGGGGIDCSVVFVLALGVLVVVTAMAPHAVFLMVAKAVEVLLCPWVLGKLRTVTKKKTGERKQYTLYTYIVCLAREINIHTTTAAKGITSISV